MVPSQSVGLVSFSPGTISRLIIRAGMATGFPAGRRFLAAGCAGLSASLGA